MEIERLSAFISQENRRLHEYHSTLDEDNTPLVQTVKLNEEMGELCDAVLGYYSLQRREKLDGVETQDIESEFADVVITALLLADSLGVDVEAALERKIETIEDRYD